MHERAIPILPGDDLAAAKAFYVGKLGFTVQFEATEDGRHGIMGLERGTIELTIDCPMSGHGRNDPSGNTLFVIGPVVPEA